MLPVMFFTLDGVYNREDAKFSSVWDIYGKR